MLDANFVEDAKRRIDKYISKTRLEKSVVLDQVYMKLENEQASVRSYKIRGVMARLTLLDEEEKKGQTAAISSGNHGVSLCYGTRLLGLKPPIIYAPINTPEPKKRKIQAYGGSLELVGENFDEASKLGEELLEEAGYIKIDSREDPLAVAGQGTLAIEIMEAEPGIDIFLAPIGSGGLITASASYLKERFPEVKVIGVEPFYCPAMSENLKNTKWTRFFPFQGETILDSLVGGVAHHSFLRAPELIDQILLVEDEEVEEAMWELLLYEKLVVEPDSAVTYAAIKKYPEIFRGKKTALVITGGNIDEGLFSHILKKRLG